MAGRMLLIAAALLLTATTGRVHAAGRTTVDPNTIKKLGQAVPAEVKDKRLDQKIEYDAGNARLHKVIDDLAKMSGVNIYCGKNADDWQTRDIPVSVASRGITLRKLLNALTLATRTAWKSVKTKEGIAYKIWPDDANQKAIDDHSEAVKKALLEKAQWDWDMAIKLKDIPMSQIEKRFSDSGSGKDDFATQIAISKLLSLLDTDTRAKIMAGENVEFTPQSAPPALSQAILDYLHAQDAVRIRQDDVARATNPDYPASPPMTLEALDSAAVRIDFNSNGDLELMGRVEVPLGQQSFIFSPSNAIVCAAGTAAVITKDDRKHPRPMGGANVDDPVSPDASFKRVHFPVSSTSALSTRTVTLDMPKDGKPKSCEEGWIALSKASGLSIVGTDFPYYGKPDVSKAAGQEMQLWKALIAVHASFEWLDEDSMVVVGSYDPRCQTLMPEKIISNLIAKANGDGVGVDDVASLARYGTKAISQWVGTDESLNGLARGRFSEEIGASRLWVFYDDLSTEEKTLAKSEAGLPLSKVDPKLVAQFVSDRTDEIRKSLFSKQRSAAERLADPAVLANAVLRVHAQEVSGDINPPTRWKRWIYMIRLGTDADRSIEPWDAYCRAMLPYYSPERTKALARQYAIGAVK